MKIKLMILMSIILIGNIEAQENARLLRLGESITKVYNDLRILMMPNGKNKVLKIYSFFPMTVE
jgi:hypothetical protein